MNLNFKSNVPDIDDTISTLVKKHFNNENAELIRQMFTAIAKFGLESTSRGDMKLLNSNIKELRYAFSIFAKYREIRKVAIFGSARTPQDSPQYKIAEQAARLLTQAGFMTITGAGGGIMEAGNKGAGKKNSFGVNIILPFEQNSNEYVAYERLINFKYFFTRKLVFLKESDATILLPGGFGTLDEGLEVITLLQTGKTKPRPIVLLQSEGETYWNRFIDFIKMGLMENGYISKNDLSLVKIMTDPKEAAKEIERFYSVYHSIRYIGPRTILRLTQKVPPRVIDDLNHKFRDMLTEGEFESCGPTRTEIDNDEFPGLPRLTMPFNKKNFDRLIDLIWYLNTNGRIKDDT